MGNEKKGKQPGNGTQKPKKKKGRDRDHRTREKEHDEQQADINKWNAQTRTAQSSSNLSLQW